MPYVLPKGCRLGLKTFGFMEYVIMIAIGVAAFILGAYCFNSIATPIFYTIPRIQKEKAIGNLAKPISMFKLIMVPIVAAIVFVGVMYLAYDYYVDYPWSVFIGFSIALIGVYTKIKSTKGEKEADFLEDYGEYLKKK
ncbi:hypothetical protein G3O08_01500 [Cryomorpha ignava]|uniref:Uncharacterized protein n=1 Tax=Cryomorpha ignava TaxID=101383 RepID=A0A7K3WKK4_9FLAO|nr:hypothetical protein [Cryomorpha ignava]NEN22177.1 hypothetical protein [Cryomorpha ignava]